MIVGPRRQVDPGKTDTLIGCGKEDHAGAKGEMSTLEGGEEDGLTKRMRSRLTRQDSTIEDMICTANQWKIRLDFKHSCGAMIVGLNRQN